MQRGNNKKKTSRRDRGKRRGEIIKRRPRAEIAVNAEKIKIKKFSHRFTLINTDKVKMKKEKSLAQRTLRMQGN